MDHALSVITHNNTAHQREALSKIAYTVREAVQASGISRSSLYLAIGCGALRAHKCGSRTVILEPDLRRFLQKLPRVAKKASQDKGSLA
jgi:hypothetical protein